MPHHLHILGYPGDVGGANTELWHTVKLWRGLGWQVTLVPTWSADPTWRGRLDALGCRTIETTPERLDRVPGLAGSVVVGMCNTHFLTAADRLRKMGCHLVWVGCMNWLFAEERRHYRRRGLFDRYVFQSRYQRDQLVPQLRRFGFRNDQGRIIRGTLDPSEFPFRPRPHQPDEAFVIGRISRAAPDKFHRDTWQIYGRTPYPIRSRMLGFNDEVQTIIGPPPPWTEVLAPGSESPQRFLSSLHAVVHAGGEAVENWPRVGLEAMAAGVPLVVDRRGGWCEMVHHGETGFLCRDADDFAFHTALLARDETLRQQIIRQARERLLNELIHPQHIRLAWSELFSRDALASGSAAKCKNRGLAPNATYFTLPRGGSDAVAAGEGFKTSGFSRDLPYPLVPRDPPGGRVKSKVMPKVSNDPFNC